VADKLLDESRKVGKHQRDLDEFFATLMPKYGDSHLTRRHKRSKLPVTAAEKALKLHAKPVGALDFEMIRAWALPAERVRLDQLMAATQVVVPARHRMSAPVADALALRDAGYIEKFFDDGMPFSAVDYFAVLEADKERRRPIFWALAMLKLSKYKSMFSLPSVAEYRDGVLLGEASCAFDLQASFAQIELPAASRMVIRDESGQLWRLNRLPYGIDVAPELMQIVLTILARRAAEDTGKPDEIVLKIHIDNVMAIGDAELLRRWKEAFLRACRDAKVSLNEEPSNAVRTTCDFVGLRHDYRDKTIQLKDSYRGKMTRDKMNEALNGTFEQLESFIGKLLYAAAALALPWDDLYWAIKWWRRQLSALSRGVMAWSELAKPPRCVRKQIDRARSIAFANEPSKVQRTAAPGAVLATDASLLGWGAVLLRPGHMPLAIGGAFATPPADISAAESVAVMRALDEFRDLLVEAGGYTLLIDNSSAVAAVKNGRPGKSAQHAVIVLEVLRRLRAMPVRARVQYVNTNDNVADAVSRAAPIDPAKADKCLAQGMGYVLVRAKG
jgi:hypothetical protein